MATDPERKIVYHATGRIHAHGVDIKTEQSTLSPGEVREINRAIQESFRGQVTSLRYTRDNYPFELTLYERGTPPRDQRQTPIIPDFFA